MAMWKNWGVSIIHRYNTVEEQCAIVASLKPDVVVGAAIGVAGDYQERAKKLFTTLAQIFFVSMWHMGITF